MAVLPTAARLGPIGGLLGVGLAWGTTLPLTKVAVSTGHHPLGLIFWQLVLMTFALSAVSFFRRRALPLDRAGLGYCLVIAVLGTVAPNSFSYVAVAHLPAGVMAIVIATVPMFALGIALTIGSETLSLRRAMGVVLGAVAVFILVAPEASLPRPGQAAFVLVAIVAPFCYAAESNYIDVRVPARIDPVSALLVASVIGALLCAPLAIAVGGFIDPFAGWGRAETALVLSSFSHAAAYSGYIALVGAAGAVFASQVSYIVTLSAIGASMLFLGEAYSAWVWVALVLMIGGLSLVRPRGEARVPETA